MPAASLLALALVIPPALAEDTVIVLTQDQPSTAQAPVVAAEPAAPTPEDTLTDVPLGVDVVPGVSLTKLTSAGDDRRALSVGLVGSYSGAVDGLELSTVVGLVQQDVDGMQATGGLNVVGGDLDGIQLAGGLNLVAGDVDGFQAAGAANITTGTVDGFQAAGAVNVAGDTVDGPQMAGAVNIAAGVDGVQMAPINISTDNVDGVQLGIVNIARDSDVSLGLINIIYEGRTHVDITQTSTGFTQAALKHGGRKFHYIYGGGINPAADCPEWSLMLGAGGHFELSRSLFIDADLLAQHISPATGFLAATNMMGTARAVAGFQLFDHIALTGGLTANTLVSTVQDGAKYADRGSVVSESGNATVRTFPGVQFGVQLF